MQKALKARGIAVASKESPIITLVLKGEKEARLAGKHFLTNGLRIPYFKYASEPRHNLLRSAARACYTEDQLQRFEEAVHTLPFEVA